jgi:hypothetical protein
VQTFQSSDKKSSHLQIVGEYAGWLLWGFFFVKLHPNFNYRETNFASLGEDENDDY